MLLILLLNITENGDLQRAAEIFTIGVFNQDTCGKIEIPLLMTLVR